MAQNSDSAASSLLCAENANTCLTHFDCNASGVSGISRPGQHQNYQISNQSPFFNSNRSKSLMGFTIEGEEIVKEMVEREREHLPRDDYLNRLRSGDLELSFRTEAIHWIWKAKTHYSFGPLSVCLAMNYMDRFLSVYELPCQAWAGQLLAVACLSLAAKMEEIKVPLLVDLQVGEPQFVFEAKTIRRMELLVLQTLEWKMQALTPCSFIDYFLSKINGDKHLSTSPFPRSVQLILNTIKSIDLLEFRPSEIAAAVAVSVSREVQAIDIDKAMHSFIHVEKGRVLKCIELIKDLSLISGSTTANVASTSASSVPQSPNGVLDAACLSYKSDDITVGSCASSSQTSSDIKRRKQDDKPSQLQYKP